MIILDVLFFLFVVIACGIIGQFGSGLVLALLHNEKEPTEMDPNSKEYLTRYMPKAN